MTEYKDFSPSLNELYKFIENYHNLNEFEKEFFDNNNFDVVYCYIFGKNISALQSLLGLSNNGEPLQNCSSVPLKYFYLGGQKKISCDTIITDELIKEVDDINNKIDMSKCYGSEIYSVIEHDKRFNNFKKLLENYKEYKTHEYYKPGNQGYLETKEHFDSVS